MTDPVTPEELAAVGEWRRAYVALAAQLEAVREERDHYAGRYREEQEAEAQLEAARKREQWLIEKNEEIQRWADTRLEAAQKVIEGVKPLAATSRCLRRPERKDEPDPGPCGKCAPCLAHRALDSQTHGGSPTTTQDSVKRKTIDDDFAAFGRGWQGAPRLSWHNEFARCPDCHNATVGLGTPYGINHATDCAAALRLPTQDSEED